MNRAQAKKAESALVLRLAGFTWTEAAHTIGYPSAERALAAVREAYPDVSLDDEEPT